MKKLIVLIGAALIAAVSVQAQPYYGFTAQPVVSSSAPSKGLAGTNWSSSVAASTSYTNVTLVSGAGARDLALQFTVADVGLSTSNVVWALARNVQGGSPTSASGAGLNLEVFAYVTNTLTGTTASTKVVNLTSTANTPTGVGVVTSFTKGAIPYVYVYSVTVPAATTLTNFSVYSTGL